MHLHLVKNLKIHLLSKVVPCHLLFCYAGTNLAASFLRANGITHLKVRDETLKLLGKADMFDKSLENPPLTVQAQRALDWAVDAKIKSGTIFSYRHHWQL